MEDGGILKGRAAVIGGGNLSQRLLPKALLSRYEYIVCCDRGGAYLWSMGFAPDLLVGDFDSLDPELLQEFRENGKTQIAEFPPEKNFTDLELGIQLAIEKGFRYLDLYGVTGSRLDHTMGSMLLLYQMQRLGGVGTILDEKNIVFLGESLVELSREWAESVFRRKAAGVRRGGNGILGVLEGDASTVDFGEPWEGSLYISLLLLTDCKGITLDGFRYPLTEYDGTYGPSLCISNELAKERGSVRLKEGRMLVIISRD